MPNLNHRQEKFCQELISGCTQVEAARRAGYPQNKDTRAQASRLAQREDIQTRLKELRELTVAHKVTTAIRRKERLSEIVESRSAKDRDVIAAIAELNRMEGSYAPTKVESRSQSLGIKEIIIHRIGNRENDTPTLP